MDFELSEQHLALRTMVRDFAEKEVRPVAQHLDQTAEFPYDIARKMGELGLMGIPFPKKYGGGGADTLSVVVAIEELARVDISMAITMQANVTLGGYPLWLYGTEEQKQRWLVPLAQGKHLGAFGLTEARGGSDAGNPDTSAVLDKGQWTINGSKSFITNSGTDMTAFVTVLAATGRRPDGSRETSNILVPKGTPGYHIAPAYNKIGWRASDTHELAFMDCRVPDGNLVGQRGAGFRQFLHVLDYGRISVATLGVGLAQACLELSLDYAKQRVAFGQTISHYQAIQFKLADMAMEVELARLMTCKSAVLADQGKPFALESAYAKLFSSETAERSASQCMQIHGGIGCMAESPAQRFYRDAKILTIGEGTSEIQRLVIARQLGC